MHTHTNSRTGFPEPLCEERNTTLPHPDADTSPNATIEAPDADLMRTNTHHSFLHTPHHRRHSFLHGRHHSQDKGLSRHVEALGLYRDITYADDHKREDAANNIESNERKPQDIANTSSQSGSSTVGSAENTGQEQREEEGGKDEEDGKKKRPFLKRLGFSKDR